MLVIQYFDTTLAQILTTFQGFVWASINMALNLVTSFTTAPFCEEIIWRGYTITRLEKRFRSIWVVVILSQLFFALWHVQPIRMLTAKKM